MTVEKPKPKQLLQPITTGAGSAINQSHVHGAIGFGFDSHWLKNWRNHAITKRSNRNHVTTFDSTFHSS